MTNVFQQSMSLVWCTRSARLCYHANNCHAMFGLKMTAITMSTNRSGTRLGLVFSDWDSTLTITVMFAIYDLMCVCSGDGGRGRPLTREPP